MFDLSEKTALVTGGSRGIGRAVAESLAGQGARVVLTYSTGEAAANDAVTAIADRGGSAEALKLDASDCASAEQAVAQVAKRLGRLDILVANAGISIDALLLRLSEQDLDRVLTVNVKGAIACARGAIKSMMRSRAGRVIFLSSVVGEMGNAGQTAYAASKAALLGVTKSLAREYASRQITVNAVSPGFVDTDMTRALTEAQREAMLSAIPLGRVATAGEVAAAVTYLASDEAAYITGQTLRVNGGMYM